MRRLPFLLLFVALFLSSSAWAADQSRIGLVLAGGGAKGSAHVGVLKVLEEMRIPIAAVAGTSMGSLVGGAYAAGVSVAEMENQLASVDWNDLFVDEPARADWPMRRKEGAARATWDFTVGVRDGALVLPKGALAGQKIGLFFTDLVRGAELIHDFDALPIPFRAVATDLEDGSMRVFSEGSLPLAMRASMSVPGAFAPTEIDGRIYVDGGLVRNLPVDVARSMGVDRLIIVYLGATYLPREKLQTVVGVMGQMVAILTEQNVERSLQEIDPRRDLVIVPELGTIGSTDFNRTTEAIAVGEAAARAAAPQLAHLSVPPAQYAAWRAARTAPIDPGDAVAEVQISGVERVNEDLFETLVANQQGRPLDRRRLEADIQAIYGRGDFEHISYRIDRQDGRRLVIVEAVEKSWGPGYLSFGLGIKTDFQGDNRFGLRGTYRRTWLNSLGGEWLSSVQLGNELEIYSELYQPLALDRSGFVAPYVQIRRQPFSVFQGDRRIARYDVSRAAAGVDLGTILFGDRAEARVGAFLAYVDASIDTGVLTFPEEQRNESGLRASFVYDTLDSSYVPRSGGRFALRLFAPNESLGAEQGFNRLDALWVGASSFGENSLAGRVRLGTSFGEDMPYYDQFDLGGFLNLSGYANEQFRGNEMAFGALILHRRIASLPPPLGRGVYAGGSLEVGLLRDTIEQLTESKTRFGGSLFLGADTWLGPVYLGLGVSGEGDATGYFMLGRP